MNLATQPIVPLGESTARTYFEWTRLSQFSQWWHWLLLIVVSLLLLSYVSRLYSRDGRELPSGIRWGLLLLRVAALAGLLIFFLDLEKRSETENVRHSRVAVLIDTSQSMGLADGSSGQRVSRLNQVVEALKNGQLIDRLREKHEVAVYRFDQASAPAQIAAFRKQSQESTSTRSTEAPPSDQLTRARQILWVSAGLAGLALFCFAVHTLFGTRWRGVEGEAYLLLAGTILLLCSVTIAGVTHLRYSQFRLVQLIGQQPIDPPPTPAPSADGKSSIPEESVPTQISWEAELVPRGIETRLGSALQWTMDKERDGPLAGIILITDGCHNAGISPESVVRTATAAEVPLFPIGMGSEKQPRNLRLVDLEVPPRVYPGDRFTITGYVQANGLAGRTVEIKLEESTMTDEPTTTTVSRRVTLGPDGEILPIQFEVAPSDIGRFRWTMQAVAPESDDLDPRDNIKQGTVQVIERKSRVLLLAGGPTRDYRFLRNLLYRDPNTQVDVLLQSAPVGAAQEANQVLLEFPSERDAMFAYDCLVAFDPDWTQFSVDQIRLLDEWVAERSGGLIAVAGPVYTNRWSRGSRSGSEEEKLRIVKDLYPVTFIGRGAASIQFGRVASETAWPLKFTDEGQRAQFLWLEDSPTGSLAAWSSFPGVYGYQALRGIKPGAQVYAQFSDPDAATQDELPVFMAGQFYGAGRCFYLGSGEMWRLNALDPRYFETFYTKLIRHVSQGRLLRDSSHGVLLVDNERCSLGETVTVRAVLSDEQYRPLELDTVDAVIVHSDGTQQPLRLRRLASSERPGMYTGQFAAIREGDLRIDLAIPGIEDELLSREVKVRLPALEIESPQRNDALLANLAKQTEGSYVVGLDAALGQRGAVPVANRIAAKDQVTYLPGTPDRRFEQRLMSWLMVLICGSLSLEWLLRRLYKLA